MNKNLFLYNERLYAEYVMSTGDLGKHKTRSLKILAKYYKHIGLSLVEVKEKIINFCKDNIKGFDIDVDFRMINNIVNYAKKNTSKLLIIDKVCITDGELKFVNDVELSEDHKKVLLGLIIQDKINEQLAINAYDVDNWKHYFGSSKSEYQTLKKNCGIKSVSVLMEIMHDLCINGLTENKIGRKPRLKFIDIIDIIDDGNIIYELKVINNFNLLYEKLNGNKKITECQVCGELIRKSNNKSIYCNICAKEINIQKTMENRNSLK